jgi:hypothetical protein
MREEFFKWCVVAALSFVTLFIIVGTHFYWAGALGGHDPYSLLRYVLLRFAAITIAAPALIGLMLIVDWITPSDWMKVIGNDPKASSYVMSAVILVIGAILCWT